MTSKEKAVQLFNKYYVSILEVNNDLSEEIIISILAKKHALIAVDEIIENGIKWMPEVEWWMQVKTEISILYFSNLNK
jgi:hypothetical protein